MLAPKNEQEAYDLLESAKSLYKELFATFEEDSDYYEGNFESYIEVPDDYDVTIPTTGRAVIDEAVDNVMPDDIRHTYPPRGNSPSSTTTAENVGRFLKSTWNYWRTYSSDIDPIYDATKNLNLYGKCAIKIVPDYTLWPSLTDERKRDLAKDPKKLKKEVSRIKNLREEFFPLVCRSIPPSCIMEDPTPNTRKQWVIERYSASEDEIRNLYSQYEESFKDFTRGTSVYEVAEIWTTPKLNDGGQFEGGKHWIYISGECVLEEDHDWLYLPYVIKYSGYGRENYEGKPELKAVGLLTKQVKSMILAEARRATHFDAIMSQLAFPIAFINQKVNLEEFSLAPGAINRVSEDVLKDLDRLWVKAPVPHPEYMASLGYISSQIERGTTQRVLRGAGVPGTDSAAQHRAIAGQAALRLKHTERALRGLIAEGNRLILYYIDEILETEVGIWAGEEKYERYVVSPSAIRGRYTTNVEFLPNEESVKERKLVLAGDAKNKLGMSRWDALTWAGFENATELVARAEADELLQEPMVKRARAKAVLIDWGYDVDNMALQEQLQAAQQQVILRDAANALQSGTLRGFGDPNQPGGGQQMPMQGAMTPMDPAMMGMIGGEPPIPPPGMMPGMPGPESMQMPGAEMAQFAPQGAPPAATNVGGTDIGGLVQDIQNLGSV